MEIKAGTQSLAATRADLRVVGVLGGGLLSEAGRALDPDLGHALERVLLEEGFEGEAGSLLVVRLPERHVGLAGLGFGLNAAGAHRLGVLIAREADRRRLKTVAVESLAWTGGARADGELALGAMLGAYRYLAFRAAPWEGTRTLTLYPRDGEADPALEAALDRANSEAAGVILARNLVNAPANALTPEVLAQTARDLAAANPDRFTAEIWDRAECERRGLGLFLAVARGSTNEPRFIQLRYRPRTSGAGLEGPVAPPENLGVPPKPRRRVVALVGKGITFDTGGYSLKTAEGMATMKADMGGAAAVLGAMKVISALRPDVEVRAYIAATDNVVAPDAMRPGDVYRGVLGKTVEVLNTDAEGRLPLADALAVADADGADAIVDLATLTGACVVALGEEVAGLWASDAALGGEVARAADLGLEKVWPMPLEAGYLEPFRSGIADLKNSTLKRQGGAIAAALFLREFVTRPWAHLDIAGPAFAAGEHANGPAGGTGFGVRTLVALLAPLEERPVEDRGLKSHPL